MLQNSKILTCLLCCGQCRWVSQCRRRHEEPWCSPCSWWWLHAERSRSPWWCHRTCSCWSRRCQYCCYCCPPVDDGPDPSWHTCLWVAWMKWTEKKSQRGGVTTFSEMQILDSDSTVGMRSSLNALNLKASTENAKASDTPTSLPSSSITLNVTAKDPFPLGS